MQPSRPAGSRRFSPRLTGSDVEAYVRVVATPALPPAWRDVAGGYPIELVREGRRRRWPWLVITVIFLFLASALCVGLPGSGHVRVTVNMAGGPFDMSGNSVGATGGRIEIHQLGRTVRRMTVPPGLSETVRLRPGFYQVDVTNIPGCGVSTIVVWGSVNHVDITCSVK